MVMTAVVIITICVFLLYFCFIYFLSLCSPPPPPPPPPNPAAPSLSFLFGVLSLFRIFFTLSFFPSFCLSVCLSFFPSFLLSVCLSFFLVFFCLLSSVCLPQLLLRLSFIPIPNLSRDCAPRASDNIFSLWRVSVWDVFPALLTHVSRFHEACRESRFDLTGEPRNEEIGQGVGQQRQR